jgi:flagellar export protein FliJ
MVQLSGAQKGLEATQVALVTARREQAKMEAMVEREARNDAAAEAKKDQRVLDETGIRLFNMKS